MAKPRVAGHRRELTPGQRLRQQVAAMGRGVIPPSADEIFPAREYMEQRADQIAENLAAEAGVPVEDVLLPDVTWPRDGETAAELIARREPEPPTHDDYLAWAQRRAEEIVAGPYDPDAPSEAWAHILDTWDELGGDETLEIVLFFASSLATPQDVDEPVDTVVVPDAAAFQEAVQVIQQARPAPARGLHGARLIPAAPVAPAAPAPAAVAPPRGMKRREPALPQAPAADATEDAERAEQLRREDAERRQRKSDALRSLGVQPSPIPPQLDPSQLASDRPTRPSGHNLPPQHVWKRDGSGRRIAPEGF